MPRATTTTSASAVCQSEEYLFFWGTNHINGWASQWYPAPFKVPVLIDGEEEILHFPSTEHWMMVQKALLFSDIDIARKILSITSTSKKDLAEVKSLGRKVRDFDEEVWHKNREKIVLEGTLHKYGQNLGLKEKLLATGDKEIVEASPRDRIWGIGYGEKNALNRFDTWGLNLLGKALVETRKVLREVE